MTKIVLSHLNFTNSLFRNNTTLILNNKLTRNQLKSNLHKLNTSNSKHSTTEINSKNERKLNKNSEIQLSISFIISTGLLTYFFLDINSAMAASEIQEHHYQYLTNNEIWKLAENEDFWGNLAQYGRFFISVMLGTGYVMVKPIYEMLKKPVTAAVVVGLLVIMYFLLSNTLQGMLGINEVEYNPTSFVT